MTYQTRQEVEEEMSGYKKKFPHLECIEGKHEMCASCEAILFYNEGIEGAIQRIHAQRMRDLEAYEATIDHMHKKTNGITLYATPDDGYNQALDDCLSLIQSLKQTV
jgi:asparagine synthetase A